MPGRTFRSILTLFVITLASSTFALTQSSDSAVDIPASSTTDIWSLAQSAGSSKDKLFVVTVDQPDRRQTCHIRSFTDEKLVCSRAIGSPRTYLPQQVAALILPGDEDLRRELMIELNGGLGAAIWGTIVLAPICPLCAVATGIVAFGFFSFAGAVAFTDDQPDQLLYLAPGQKLSGKLGYVKR
jgi:hypothetical protein